MNTNEKWRRLARMWREAEASGTALVAFAIALAVAWSAALVVGLTPVPEAAHPGGPPDAESPGAG